MTSQESSGGSQVSFGSLGSPSLAKVAKDAQRAARDGRLSATSVPNFHVHGKSFRFSEVSLFCLYPGNVVRESAVWLTQHWLFDAFILTLIVLNSIVLALSDYGNVDSDGFLDTSGSWRNLLVERSEPVFTGIFTAEMVLKIVAMGFVWDKGSYLADPWNVLDFVVVATALLSNLPGVTNVSAFRVIRVLRPLRSLNAVPGMKLLVQSLLKSIPGLLSVVMLLSFVFMIFGILGVQLWAGVQHARCRLTSDPVRVRPPGGVPAPCLVNPVGEECMAAFMLDAEDLDPTGTVLTIGAAARDSPVAAGGLEEDPRVFSASAMLNTNVLERCLPGEPVNDDSWTQLTSPWRRARDCFWPVDPELERICSLPGWELGDYKCPAGRWCGSNYDASGNERFAGSFVQRSATYLSSLNFGLTTFDHIGKAFVTIFQSITLEGWVDIMYQIMDGYNGVVAAVYFVFLVIFGSFFLLQLTLAVIWDEYNKGQEEAAEKEREAVKDAEQKKKKEAAAETQRLRDLGREQERRRSQMVFHQGQQPVGAGAGAGAKPSGPVTPMQNRKSKRSLLALNREHGIIGAVKQISAESGDEKGIGAHGDAGGGAIDAGRAAAESSGTDVARQSKGSTSEQDEREKSGKSGHKGGERGTEGENGEEGGGSGRKLMQKVTQHIVAGHGKKRRMSGYSTEFLLRLRAEKLGIPQWRLCCFMLVSHPFFHLGIMLLILLNTVVLAIDHYPMNQDLARQLEIVNFALTLSFAVEMVLKLIGLGPWLYAQDAFNLFDAVIVVASLVEVIVVPPGFLTPAEHDDGPGARQSAVSALRTFRLFRVFALARQWKSLRILLHTIMATLRDVANFAVLLLLFMFIFALVGMQLFANELCFDPETGRPADEVAPEVFDENPAACPDPFERPRSHFDTLLWAFVTVFQVLTGENWNTVMYDCIRGTSWAAAVYFLALIIMGDFIVLNLFLAILLGSFDDVDQLTGEPVSPSSRVAPVPMSNPVGVVALPVSQARPSSGIASNQVAPEPLPVLREGGKQAGASPAGIRARSQDGAGVQDSKQDAGEDTSAEQQVQAMIAAEHEGDAKKYHHLTPEEEEDMLSPMAPLRHSVQALGKLFASIGGSTKSAKEGSESGEQSPRRRPEQGHASGSRRRGDASAVPTPSSLGGGEAEANRRGQSGAMSATVAAAKPPPHTQGGQAKQEQAEPNRRAVSNPETGTGSPPGGPVLSSVSEAAGRLARHPFLQAKVRNDAQAGGHGSPDILEQEEGAATQPAEQGGSSSAAASRGPPVLARAVDSKGHAAGKARSSGVYGPPPVAAGPAVAGASSTPKSRESMIKGARSSVDTALSMPSQSAFSGRSSRMVNRRISLHGHSMGLLAPQNCVRASLDEVVQHPWFDRTVMVLIAVSSILLAVDSPFMDPNGWPAQALRVTDIVLTCLFTVEMALKIIVLGVVLHRNAYFRSWWNVLDAFIVVVSILSLSAGQGQGQALKSLRSLRALRAFRPLRFISRNPGLKLVVQTLLTSMRSILNVLFVCVLFFLIFSILGTSYFKGSFHSCGGEAFEEASPVLQGIVQTPGTFAELFSPAAIAAIHASLMVSAGAQGSVEDLSAALAVRQGLGGAAPSAAVDANLDALLKFDFNAGLQSFNASTAEGREEARLAWGGSAEGRTTAAVDPLQAVLDAVDAAEQALLLEAGAVYVPYRDVLEARDDGGSTANAAQELMLQGPRLSVQDQLSVLESLSAGDGTGEGGSGLGLLEWAAPASAFLGRIPGRLDAYRAGERGADAAALLYPAWRAPPPGGVNATRGAVDSAAGAASLLMTNGSCCLAMPPSGAAEAPRSMHVCEWLDFEWDLPVDSGFDNVLEGMVTLFQMATTEGWLEIMYAGVDATGVEMQPVRDATPLWVFFFIGFMVIGAFFVTNLFVGIIIENFNREKERLGDAGGIFMTPEQREWVRTRREMIRIRPIKAPEPSEYACVRTCRSIAESENFEAGILVCIVLNALFMAIAFFGQPHQYAVALDVINYVFAGIFTVEAAIKLVGLGAGDYFCGADGAWNSFDFTVVVGTLLGIALQQAAIGVDVGGVATVVRTFRIARVVRLVKRAKQIRQLAGAVYWILPSLGNIGGLLFLLFFIYAVMGVQLFATVQLQGALTEQANFQTFFRAMLTLMRASTGEGWNAIMYSAGAQPDGCRDLADIPYDEKLNMCKYSGAEPGCEPVDGCGSIAAAYAYFLSFTLLITFVFLNLFVAVVIEGFEESGKQDSMRLGEGHLKQFLHMWMKYDPHATESIKIDQLLELLQRLPEPMGFGLNYKATDSELRMRAASLRIPLLRGKHVHFEHVVKALALRVFVVTSAADGKPAFVPPDEPSSLRREARRAFRRRPSDEMTGFGLDNFLAAKAIEKLFRARLVRKQLNKRISSKGTGDASGAAAAVRQARLQQHQEQADEERAGEDSGKGHQPRLDLGDTGTSRIQDVVSPSQPRPHVQQQGAPGEGQGQGHDQEEAGVDDATGPRLAGSRSRVDSAATPVRDHPGEEDRLRAGALGGGLGASVTGSESRVSHGGSSQGHASTADPGEGTNPHEDEDEPDPSAPVASQATLMRSQGGSGSQEQGHGRSRSQQDTPPPSRSGASPSGRGIAVDASARGARTGPNGSTESPDGGNPRGGVKGSGEERGRGAISMQAMGGGKEGENPAHLDKFLQHVASQGGSARLPAPPTKFIVTRSGRRLGVGADGDGDKVNGEDEGKAGSGVAQPTNSGAGVLLPSIHGATGSGEQGLQSPVETWSSQQQQSVSGTSRGTGSSAVRPLRMSQIDREASARARNVRRGPSQAAKEPKTTDGSPAASAGTSHDRSVGDKQSRLIASGVSRGSPATGASDVGFAASDPKAVSAGISGSHSHHEAGNEESVL